MLEIAANGYSYCKDLLNKDSDTERLARINEKQRKLGQEVYDLLFQKGDFFEALRDAEIFGLGVLLIKKAATKYIRQLIVVNRKKAMELADKYKIDDVDILEKLTNTDES